MSHDLIIRNGTVVDGTGADRVVADIAVDGDRISVIGDLREHSARRELDASGHVVSPGFVDLHTHLDAQIGWDPYMTSSSWHGVTTVLMGNCGVTFAPASPDNRSYLAEMMESVEDIPKEAILDGLPWDWQTYGEYLDSVERLAPALNVVGLVGHCAVRYHVMGERSLTDEEPTADELRQIADIAAESVADGAVGYSTSRLLGHVVPDGRCVPGTFSSIDEYLAIADGMNRAGGGLFQAVLDFDTKAGHEFHLLRSMAERCGDVLFSGGVGDRGLDGVNRFNDFLTTTNAEAGRINSLAMSRPSGFLIGITQEPPVKGSAWKALMELSTITERVAALRNSSTRAELVAEAERKGMRFDPRMIYPLGMEGLPDYHLDGEGSLADLASAAGVSPIAAMIDRLIESNGRELFNVWFFNRNVEALGEFLHLENVCPNLGDAGAHVGQICDADAPTFYLRHWNRVTGRVSIEQAVQGLTQKPAAVLGLKGRGTLAVGEHADINVFSPERLETLYPEYVHDLPGGKGRLQARSAGYAATLVNGEIVVEEGQHTGARPGRVIREFARGRPSQARPLPVHKAE